MNTFTVVARRFAKGFVAGGLAQIALIINGGVTIHSLADVKAVLSVLLAAFITGGLLALEKLLNYDPTPPSVTPSTSQG